MISADAGSEIGMTQRVSRAFASPSGENDARAGRNYGRHVLGARASRRQEVTLGEEVKWRVRRVAVSAGTGRESCVKINASLRCSRILCLWERSNQGRNLQVTKAKKKKKDHCEIFKMLIPLRSSPRRYPLHFSFMNPRVL